MTHAELVQRAARWLRNTEHCSVVLTELDACGMEIPDAIGWKYGNRSTLIECKVSRSDFRRDAKKLPRRHNAHAIGARRYYLAPAGVIPINELTAGWGLLELSGNRLIKSAQASNVDAREPGGVLREMRYLVSALRRAEELCEGKDLDAWIKKPLIQNRERAKAARLAMRERNKLSISFFDTVMVSGRVDQRDIQQLHHSPPSDLCVPSRRAG